MKPAIEIPFMKARNLEDMETIRHSKRQIILYEMRNTTHYGVELELQKAMTNPQKMQDVWDSVPNIAHDIASMDFKTRVAAIHKIYFIIVVLKHLAGTDQYVEALVQSGIIRHLLLYIRSHPLCRGRSLIKAAEVLLQLMQEYLVLIHQGLIDHAGGAAFARLLHSSQNKVKVLAVGAILYARFLPQQYRDTLLDHGAATLIAELLRPQVQLPLLDDAHEEVFLTAIYCLLGLCSGDPLPAYHQVETFVPIVQILILTIVPFGIYFNVSITACWTLVFILRILKTDHQQLLSQEIVGGELCQRLIFLMQSMNQEPLAMAVHNVVYELITNDNAFVQILINHGIIPALNNNLHQDPMYPGLACETIHVMIYFNPAVVQQVLFDGNLMPLLLQIIQDYHAEIRIKVAAVNALSEAARTGSDAQIDMMVNLECIQILCEYLNNDETRYLCIQGLASIVEIGNRQREIAQLVRQFGGVTLGALWDDEDVGAIAQWILEATILSS